MKIRIWHLARPAIDDGRYEAEEVWLDMELPFVPQAGAMLRVDGPVHPLTVDHAYWDASNPDLVHVFTRDPHCLPTMRQMRASGWLGAEESAAGRAGATTPP